MYVGGTPGEAHGLITFRGGRLGRARSGSGSPGKRLAGHREHLLAWSPSCPAACPAGSTSAVRQRLLQAMYGLYCKKLPHLHSFLAVSVNQSPPSDA